MTLPRERIVEELKSQGLVFSEINIRDEGVFQPADVLWNASDMAHINYLHTTLRGVFPYMKDSSYASIFLPKFLGLTLPYVSVNYISGPNRHTHYTAFLLGVVIVEYFMEPLDHLRTKITITYSIGTLPWLRILHPFLRWALRKNYWNVAGEDIPVRERRGELRSWGYAFKNEETPCERTLDISTSNVLTDAVAAPSSQERLNLAEALPQDGEFLLGKSDHWGLRLIREGGRLLFFERLCPHEGASLDKPPCRAASIRCPWHGRVFHPLAAFDLAQETRQEAGLRHHKIALENGVLTVQYGT